MPSRVFGAAQFSAHGQNTRGVGHLRGEAGDYWQHPPATPNREPSSAARRERLEDSSVKLVSYVSDFSLVGTS
ncbi:MAG: hypothetical protein ABW346_09760 [Terrimicrobium sp.]